MSNLNLMEVQPCTSYECATRNFHQVGRQSLRVKIKSLAEEARIIRQEERRVRGSRADTQRGYLHWHRVNIVRAEARAAQLAYAFLRGNRSYKQTEPNASEPVWIDRVKRLVSKFGWYDQATGAMEKWLTE